MKFNQSRVRGNITRRGSDIFEDILNGTRVTAVTDDLSFNIYKKNKISIVIF